ncbi:MAG: M15 family metallopeptidase [Cyanobacteria bacterium REEB459]|nr:M15 family metallopeptidase [Cyanobacteria bacterium REEB459]
MPPLDDIPEATRDLPLGTVLSSHQAGDRLPRLPRRLVITCLTAMLALGAGGVTAWYQTTNLRGSAIAPSSQKADSTGAAPIATGSSPPGQDQSTPTSPDVAPTLLGHHAYDQANAAELISLKGYAAIRLRPAAATALAAMIQAAAKAGVRLVPLSGYRSYQDQEKVFFSLQAARHQTVQTRAEVSAPPGYSEHHTGYALDLGDGDQPGTNLDQSFLNTRAYDWMKTNAVSFGFELSFPPDNSQGVAFEPWHWRFVGDRQSLETFYRK